VGSDPPAASPAKFIGFVQAGLDSLMKAVERLLAVLHVLAEELHSFPVTSFEPVSRSRTDSPPKKFGY
jgi:hypothetical protein